MRSIVWLTALVTVCGCTSVAWERADKTDTLADAPAAPLKSGVILANFDRSIRPGDDFTGFVNGAWLKTAEIPADKATYGVGYMVHERSQDDVKAIIETAAAGNFAAGSDEQKVGDLYRSYMDMDRRNALGATPLAADLARIDASGAIHLLGRETDVINVFGMKVVPSEVEEVIGALPEVAEVKVYAGRHRASGFQFVKAALVGEALDESKIRAHCQQHLVYYKRPERIAVLEALPRSPAGKIIRDQLP